MSCVCCETRFTRGTVAVFKTLWLQQYFGSQTWYDPNETSKTKQVTGIDKTNIETIVAYENKLHNSTQHEADHQRVAAGAVC